MVKKWRSGSTRTLNARPIKRIEYPMLINAMKEDGLTATITEKGVVWFYGDYEVKRTSVMSQWELSSNQMRTFESHILETNPFGGYYEGNNYLNG